jgi:large subunit ribosomal protein L15
MGLDKLAPAEGATHRKKVIGRGPGSGHGKNATRGHKGRKKHGQVNPNFEGGQTPLHRRLPHLRGFKPVNRIEYAVVNVGLFAELEAGTEVTPEFLYQHRLLRDPNERLKVLADGEVTVAIHVKAHKFSAAAKAKLEAAGGTAEVL